MRKTTLFLIIAAGLFLIAARPALRPVLTGGDYRVYIEKSDKNAEYRVNDFYSVYYIYMNVIRAIDLTDRLGDRDIEKLISLIIDNLKKRNVVQLQIDNYKGSGTLRVTLRSDLAPRDGEPALWVLSNYHAQTKRVVSGDEEKDAYATFFYLMGDKLVKYQRIQEPKSEAELKKMPVNDRADYYLLDAVPENDEIGKDLLVKEIGREKDAPVLAFLYMTLSEYHLLDGDVKSARQSLDKARTIINSLVDEKRRASLSKVLQHADDVYRYYIRYTGGS